MTFNLRTFLYRLGIDMQSKWHVSFGRKYVLSTICGPIYLSIYFSTYIHSCACKSNDIGVLMHGLGHGSSRTCQMYGATKRHPCCKASSVRAKTAVCVMFCGIYCFCLKFDLELICYDTIQSRCFWLCSRTCLAWRYMRMTMLTSGFM